MLLKTPKHRATLLTLANLAWISLSPAAALYFERQQRQEAYPIEADSIGLPIAGIAMWVIIFLLPLNILCWLLLRRYPGKVPLAISGKSSGIGKRIIGVCGIILAVTCIAGAVYAVADDAFEVGPVFVAWTYIMIAMRAAYLAGDTGSQNLKQSPDQSAGLV